VKSSLFRINRRQTGFGLLEALVALVLLSSIGFALLAWIDQNLDTMQRMRGFYAEQEARRTVAEWAYTLNPMETPSGELVIGALHLSWKSVPQDEKVSQMGYPAGIGLHDVALYDVDVSVFRQKESVSWFSEKIVCVGFRKVRDLRNPFQNG
jgi:general secretion pathway protein I